MPTVGSPTPSWRRNRQKLAANRLMALGGAVVVAVYAAGYARTEPQARLAEQAAAAFTQHASVTSPAQAASASAATTTPSSVAASQAPDASTGGAAEPSASTAQGASSSPATTGYKDGTYTATGWGPHGPIQVTVVIRGGRIASANVTACGTTYSCAYVQPLVDEVIQRQGPPVDYVSRATASSIAYYQAVTQALAQAQG